MTELVLRTPARDEVPAIVGMLADDALGQSRESVTGGIPQLYYDAFDEIAAEPNDRLLIAEQDSEIVGTLQLTFIRGLSRRGAKRCLIEAVRVASGHRGRGLGEEMTRAVIEMARGEGCAMVQLTTDKRRKDAHRFYERLGFVASHEGMKLDIS